MSLLEDLPQQSIAPEDLQTNLEDIAERLLCRRFHQGQATAVANKWKNTILAELNRQSRLEAPRRSRKVQAAGGVSSIRPAAHVHERQVAEQRSEQLQRGECPICYGGFNMPCETACLHIFCHDCVAPWVQRHGNCPSCRAQVTVHELVMVEPLHRQSAASRPRRTTPDRPRTIVQRPTIAPAVAAPASGPSREAGLQITRRPALPTPLFTFAAGSRPTNLATPRSTPIPRTVPVALPAPVLAPAVQPIPHTHATTATAATPQSSQQAREARVRVRETWRRRLEKLNEGCPICLEEMEEPCETMCKHIACHDCMVRWLDTRHTCPLCRTGVIRESLLLI